MLVLLAVLVLLTVAGLRILRLHARGGNAAMAAACFVGVCVALAHSWADYPLRTTALNTTVAVLAGLMLVSLEDARGRVKVRRESAKHHNAPEQAA